MSKLIDSVKLSGEDRRISVSSIICLFTGAIIGFVVGALLSASKDDKE